MSRLFQLLSAAMLRIATRTYSLKSTMFSGPEFKTRGEIFRSENISVCHIFDNRDIRHSVPRRDAYEVSDVVVSSVSGNVYWKGLLIQESSAWPPERVNLKLETWRHSKDQLEGEGLLIPLPSNPYYHWLLEDLPAVLALIKRYPQAALLVSSSRPKYVDDFLKVSKIPFESTGRLVRAKRVLFVDKQGTIGVPTANNVNELSSFAYQQGLVKKSESQGECLIYISRLFASRSPDGEGWLINELSAAGVKIVNLEKLQWPDQIDLFSRSTTVIGLHGAGLANTAFCRPGTKVIELLDEDYPNNCFEILAEKSNLIFSRVLFKGALTRATLDKVLQQI